MKFANIYDMHINPDQVTLVHPDPDFPERTIIRFTDGLARSCRLHHDRVAAEIEIASEIAAQDPEFLEVQDTPEEAAQLLGWFTMRPDLELTYTYELEPHNIPKAIMKPGALPEEGWTVHKRHGGRNDQEWTMVAVEATAIEALREAHKAFCDGR